MLDTFLLHRIIDYVGFCSWYLQIVSRGLQQKPHVGYNNHHLRIANSIGLLVHECLIFNQLDRFVRYRVHEAEFFLHWIAHTVSCMTSILPPSISSVQALRYRFSQVNSFSITLDEPSIPLHADQGFLKRRRVVVPFRCFPLEFTRLKVLKTFIISLVHSPHFFRR